MLFGLWGSSTKKERLIKPPDLTEQRPQKDHRLTNALKNFIKLGDGENLLSRRSELRAGSLSYLASRSLEEIEPALDSLENLGALHGKTKTEIINDLEKLFARKELKTHYQSKSSTEIDNVHQNLRTIAAELAKEEAPSLAQVA